MFLVPYDRLQLPSPLAVEEVKRRISANVDLTRPLYFLSNYSREYGGRATPSGFVLKRQWPHLRSRIGITVGPQGSGSVVGITIIVRSFFVLPYLQARSRLSICRATVEE